MAKAETSTRAPRGSKAVVQAFFAALDDVPPMQQGAVVKAAQAMIREQLALRRSKAAAASARAATRAPAAAPAKRTAAGRAAGTARKATRGRRAAV